jgi:hypothetical protein
LLLLIVGAGDRLLEAPRAVVFKGVEHVLAIRINEFGPRLPQRLYYVVNEANLR